MKEIQEKRGPLIFGWVFLCMGKDEDIGSQQEQNPIKL